MRNSLVTTLTHYQPIPEEAHFKQPMINFVHQNPHCFERSLEVGHITASAWVLNRDHSKALLMHHTKLNMWLQLGGHCDGDPDVLGVALREAREESGIPTIIPVDEHIFDIDIHRIPANSHEKEHFHYDIRFLLYTPHEETVVQNHESTELRWITHNINALPTNSPSVRRMFFKWISRFPKSCAPNHTPIMIEKKRM